MISFHPFPVIETSNLILRRMEDRDLSDLFEMRRDPKMHEHTDTKPDKVPEETKAYIDKINKGVDENKWICWAIECKRARKVIGSISIWNICAEEGSAELGYGLVSAYQGKGLMKEALLKVVNFGFEVMDLKILDAYTGENNIGSIRLLESCRFREVDRVDDAGCCNDRMYHMIVYRIGKTDQNNASL